MKKKTVLIIDDDRTLLNELKTMLQLNGYDAEVLDDTSRAVRVAEEIQPEVILLDLKMSGKSGFQIADDLKTFCRDSEYTGHRDDGLLHRAAAQKVHSFPWHK